MRRTAMIVALLAAPAMLFAQDEAPEMGEELQRGKQLFEGICSACHSLDLPRSQRLTRPDWEWVLEDMVKKFGCPINEEQGALILEYLVEFHGPDS